MQTIDSDYPFIYTLIKLCTGRLEDLYLGCKFERKRKVLYTYQYTIVQCEHDSKKNFINLLRLY